MAKFQLPGMGKYMPPLLGIDPVVLAQARQENAEVCKCMCHKVGEQIKITERKGAFDEKKGKFQQAFVPTDVVKHRGPCCIICPKCKKNIAVGAMSMHRRICEG